MTLTEKEIAKLLKLQEEIDREAAGKCRKSYIQNRTRQVRLVIRKANRRERELEARRKTHGVQLSLF